MNYLVYGIRTDNGIAATYTATFALPPGTNLLIGYTFGGAANTYIRVFDRAVSNATNRLNIYTTAVAHSGTCAMAFTTNQIYLQLVTPSQGYFYFNVTVQNDEVLNKWKEKTDPLKRE